MQLFYVSWELFIALRIQRAMRMRHIFFVSRQAVQYFPTLCNIRQDLQRIFYESNMFVSILSRNLSDISHSKKNWMKYNNKYTRSSCKIHLILSDFNWAWNFLTDFLKLLKCQISWEFAWWKPSCSMQTDRKTDRHTDRQTDRLDEDNRSFSQCCEKRLNLLKL